MKKIKLFILFLLTIIGIGGLSKAAVAGMFAGMFPPAPTIQQQEEAMRHNQDVINRFLGKRRQVNTYNNTTYRDTPSTYGYSKHMLKQLALNETNASEYLPQILANNLFSFVNGFRAFNELTRNRGVLDSMVYGYFSNSLTSDYGEIKTSFLRNIGVGIETNITYTTILKNANDFLDTVKYNDKYIFDSLFNKDFGRRHMVVTSSEPAGIIIAKSINGGSNFGGIPIHHNYQPYISLLRYYPPTFNNVNFYSLVYYLFKEIDYGHGKRKRIAEKLLSDIILRRFNNAKRMLHRNFKPPKHNSYLELLSRIETMSYMLTMDARISYPQIPSCYVLNGGGILPSTLKCGANLKIIVPYPVTKKQIANLELLKDRIDTEIRRYDSFSETGKIHTIVLNIDDIISNYKKIRIYFDWFNKFKTNQYWKNPIER